jgi:hypothetical protein
MNKSYLEIVKTCKLVDYREEFAAKGSVWKEYWQDTDKKYTALFTNHQQGTLPHTIYTQYE